MAVLHVHWPDELPAEELVGLLIGHAHSRGFCIEHDGAADRLAIYSAKTPDPGGEPASAAADAKVVPLAVARQRRLAAASATRRRGELR
jgi:hypothetical protein